MEKFSIQEVLVSKQQGEELTHDQIDWMINAIVNKEIAGVQIGALLMAIFFQGMTTKETVSLTSCMTRSGEVLTWPEEWNHLVVDKHSTGGVGDKISLVLAPAIAACGLKVPMISGRSLGHTGGTLDKLESIPGFRTDLSKSECHRVLKDVGCFIVGQTEHIVPADKILYAARDVTSTVASMPLVTASIVSKKAAEGIKYLVMDVKCGKAAFFKDIEDAKQLANMIAHTSTGLGIKTSAVISNMDHPIGFMVGNSLEVLESVLCLQGKGPDDLMELVTTQGGELLHLQGKVNSLEQGKIEITKVIKDGRALDVFRRMTIAQGVKEKIANKLCVAPREVLPISANAINITAPCGGYINNINAMVCGEVSCTLGNGRKLPSDQVSHHCGLELLVKVGDSVSEDQPLMTIYYDDCELIDQLKSKLIKAFEIIDTKPETFNSKIFEIIRV